MALRQDALKLLVMGCLACVLDKYSIHRVRSFSPRAHATTVSSDLEEQSQVDLNWRRPNAQHGFKDSRLQTDESFRDRFPMM